MVRLPTEKLFITHKALFWNVPSSPEKCYMIKTAQFYRAGTLSHKFPTTPQKRIANFEIIFELYEKHTNIEQNL